MSDDFEPIDKCVINERVKAFNTAIVKNNNIWGLNDLGIQAKNAAMSMLSTKHGLYANIPIICKGERCPYAYGCQLFQYNLAPESNPCPIEIAQIEMRYQAYDNDFDLENASFTDTVIVNEIIETDIMMERCKKLIEQEALPIQDRPVSVDQNGDVLYAPDVSKTIELNERLSKKRIGLFNMMKATRKDKDVPSETGLTMQDLLELAIQKEVNNEFIIDIKPDNLE